MALRMLGAAGERGRKAIYRGHVYSIQIKGTPTVRSRWQCVKRSCKAALRIDAAEENAEEVGVHTHVPDWGYLKAKEERYRLLEQARRDRNIPTARLTRDALGRVDSETLVKMPAEKALKKAIRRVRREEHPALPKTFDELHELPQRYKVLNGETWLQFDSRQEEEDDEDEDEALPRFLLFATTQGLQQLSRSQMWYGDGTFKTVPRIAGQLYTIHYEKMGHTFPAVYILMQNRRDLLPRFQQASRPAAGEPARRSQKNLHGFRTGRHERLPCLLSWSGKIFLLFSLLTEHVEESAGLRVISAVRQRGRCTATATVSCNHRTGLRAPRQCSRCI